MSAPAHAPRIGRKEEILSACFFFDKHKPSGHLSMHGFGKKMGREELRQRPTDEYALRRTLFPRTRNAGSTARVLPSSPQVLLP